MTFRQEFDNACHQINTYKHPSIGEFKEKLSSILEAADIGGITHDCLESLDEDDDTIYIETTWSARGCNQSSSYQLPSFIIDAEDPLKAAKIWGLEKKIGETTHRLNAAKRDVESQQSQLEALTKSLGEAQ